MNPIETRFRRTVSDYGLLSPGDRVTVALSGGADSVALLLLLLSLGPEWKLNISAAHLNHQLRGMESQRDADFAASLCAERGVPLTLGSVDVMGSKRPHEGTEAAARRLRYAFLEEAAAGGKIATAHTADDQAETVLLRLLRGSGLKGLCGIPIRRGRIIRPLLEIPESMIRAFLNERGQPFVEDSSNATDDYARNRLRRHVMPVLRQWNPNLEARLGETCRSLTQDAALLDALAADALSEASVPDGLRAEPLLAQPEAIRSRVLRRWAEERDCPLSAYHTRQMLALLEQGGGRRGLPGGWTVALYRGVLRLLPPAGEAFCLDFSGLQAAFQGRLLTGKREKAENVHNLLSKDLLDCAKIQEGLVVRSRLPGDAYRPAGRGCTKTLKKLFQEAGIPAAGRGCVPVLADGAGILWVAGFGPDERAAVTAGTREILQLTYREES